MAIYAVRNDKGQEFDVDEDKLPMAAKDGYLPVVSNGRESHRVDASDLHKAAQDGYHPAIYREVDKAEDPGVAAALLRQGIHGGTFGLSDELVGAGKAIEALPSMDLSKISDAYTSGRDVERAAIARTRAEHPIASLVGELGGGIASGQALPAITGATGLARMGQAAAIGGGLGLAGSDAPTAKGQAYDAGIGALTGGTLQGAGEAIAPLLQRAAGPLKGLAGRLAEKATGATGREAQQFAEGTGNELLNRGLIKFGDTFEDIAHRVEPAAEQAGQNIGNALEKATGQGANVDLGGITSTLKSKIQELSKVPGNETIIRQLEAAVDNLGSRAEQTLPLDLAEQAKRNYQGMVNYASPEADKKAAAQIARTFKDAVESGMESSSPELASGFTSAKKEYGMLAPVREALERKMSQMNQSPIGGFGDLMAAGAGAAAGGREGAMGGVAAKHTITPRVTSSLAVTANNLSDLVSRSPQIFGRYAPALQNAAMRGADALGATHFILSQTDPNYREQINGGSDGR